MLIAATETCVVNLHDDTQPTCGKPTGKKEGEVGENFDLCPAHRAQMKKDNTIPPDPRDTKIAELEKRIAALEAIVKGSAPK